MNTTRISVIAAAAAVAAWAVKSVAIGSAGGLNKSPLEGPFFFLGLIFLVVSVCALALSVVRRREWWARSLTIAGSLVGIVVLIVVSGLAATALQTNDHWVWSEVTLWVSSLGVLAGCVWYSSRPRVREA